jgi:hypothetical protein
VAVARRHGGPDRAGPFGASWATVGDTGLDTQ